MTCQNDLIISLWDPHVKSGLARQRPQASETSSLGKENRITYNNHFFKQNLIIWIN